MFFDLSRNTQIRRSEMVDIFKELNLHGMDNFIYWMYEVLAEADVVTLEDMRQLFLLKHDHHFHAQIESLKQQILSKKYAFGSYHHFYFLLVPFMCMINKCEAKIFITLGNVIYLPYRWINSDFIPYKIQLLKAKNNTNFIFCEFKKVKLKKMTGMFCKLKKPQKLLDSVIFFLKASSTLRSDFKCMSFDLKLEKNKMYGFWACKN